MSAKEKIKHPYYSFDKLFSFNATFMFCVGGRGLGKTYGATKKAIKDALYKDEQFIYLRRYKDELSAARGTFFAALIANNEFPDYDFRVDANQAQASGIEFRDTKHREWKTLGYFIALSTAQQQKSVAFPLVRTIIFDEFIIEKGMVHYLPNEAKAFINFYSTVDRWQDKTRVLFLANAVSVSNPYFLEYRIRPDKDTEWVKTNDGFIVANFVDSAAFSESVLATRFGRFIADTEYADYAVGNQFADNHSHLLKMKSEDANYLYTLLTPSGNLSVWYAPRSQQYYGQEKRPKVERLYVTDQRMMTDETSYLPPNSKLLQYLRTGFNQGRFGFDTAQSRNAAIEIFRK